MQPIPIHPSLVHVPIALAVIMPLMLLGLFFFIRRGSLPEQAWWIGVLMQAVLVIGALTAGASGHKEEERVEELVPHAAIEKHEHFAGAMTGATIGVLILAAAALRKGKASSALRIAAITLSLATFALAGLVGHAGGELVYKHGAAAPPPSPMQHAPSPEEEAGEAR